MRFLKRKKVGTLDEFFDSSQERQVKIYYEALNPAINKSGVHVKGKGLCIRHVYIRNFLKKDERFKTNWISSYTTFLDLVIEFSTSEMWDLVEPGVLSVIDTDPPMFWFNSEWIRIKYCGLLKASLLDQLYESPLGLSSLFVAHRS